MANPKRAATRQPAGPRNEDNRVALDAGALATIRERLVREFKSRRPKGRFTSGTLTPAVLQILQKIRALSEGERNDLMRALENLDDGGDLRGDYGVVHQSFFAGWMAMQLDHADYSKNLNAAIDSYRAGPKAKKRAADERNRLIDQMMAAGRSREDMATVLSVQRSDLLRGATFKSVMKHYRRWKKQQRDNCNNLNPMPAGGPG
jgi:hypothetical protein